MKPPPAGAAARSPLLVDVVREAHRLETRMLATLITRRERLVEDDCHLVLLRVRRVVRHLVDAGRLYLIAGLGGLGFNFVCGCHRLCRH